MQRTWDRESYIVGYGGVMIKVIEHRVEHRYIMDRRKEM